MDFSLTSFNSLIFSRTFPSFAKSSPLAIEFILCSCADFFPACLSLFLRAFVSFSNLTAFAFFSSTSKPALNKTPLALSTIPCFPIYLSAPVLFLAKLIVLDILANDNLKLDSIIPAMESDVKPSTILSAN